MVPVQEKRKKKKQILISRNGEESTLENIKGYSLRKPKQIGTGKLKLW